MTIAKIAYDGVEYDVAPMEPELSEVPTLGVPYVITPEVARSYLKYNWRNRNQRVSGVRNYGSDMAAGRYDLNGTTITFSRPLKAGEDEDVPAGMPVLIDGQHRLMSCIESGAPFMCYLIFGLPPLSRKTVDNGIKRKFMDDLQMDGEVNAAVLAAVTLRCLAWSIGDRHLTLKREGLTKSAQAEFLGEHPELRRSTHIASQVHAEFMNSGIRKSVVGTAHWLLMQADPEMAPEFFARLGDGAEMPKDHPIMQLRRRITKDKMDRDGSGRRNVAPTPDWQQLVYIIRCWNGLKQDRANFALLSKADHSVMPRIETAPNVSSSIVKLFEQVEEQGTYDKDDEEYSEAS